MTLQMADSSILITVAGPEPNWLYPTLNAFQRLGQLADNWDSYEGRRIHVLPVVTALKFLDQIFDDDGPVPAVVPTTRGGVQLEWYGDEVTTEVEFDLAGKFSGMIQSHGGLEWEFDQLTPDVVRRLQAALSD